jgi:hypothetical protein
MKTDRAYPSRSRVRRTALSNGLLDIDGPTRWREWGRKSREAELAFRLCYPVNDQMRADLRRAYA